MKNLQRLLLLTFLASVAFSCNREEDPAPRTKTDILTAKSWRIESLTVTPPLPFENDDETITAISDLYNQVFGACLRDDIISFRKDGQRYTVEDMGTSCGGDKIRGFGTWVFSSDESAILLTGGAFVSLLTGSAESWNVTELTDTSLVVTTIIAGERTNYTATYRFTAL